VIAGFVTDKYTMIPQETNCQVFGQALLHVEWDEGVQVDTGAKRLPEMPRRWGRSRLESAAYPHDHYSSAHRLLRSCYPILSTSHSRCILRIPLFEYSLR
jgi:hypothetical protein